MEFDDLAAGEPGAVMLRAKAAGAAVEHFAAHLRAIARSHSRAKLETDFAPGRPPRLAPLFHVLAGPCF